MKFQDFTRQQLIGKAVLWTQTGDGRGTVKTVTKIIQTPSEGFIVEGGEGKVFNYFTGYQKAHSGRMGSVVSKCELVTEEQIAQVREEWTQIQAKRAQENLQRQRDVLQESMDKVTKLHSDMAILQDRLQVQSAVTDKLQLIITIAANTDRLSALSIDQLRELAQRMNL